MAVIGSITLKGAEGLLQALQELEPRVSKMLVRKGLRAGAKPMLAAAKAKAPVSVDGSHGNPPGTLRDSLKIRAIKRNRRGNIGVAIQTKEGDYKGKTFYGAFIEYGTKKMAAKPYMRPAFDSTKAQSVAIITDTIRDELNKTRAKP